MSVLSATKLLAPTSPPFIAQNFLPAIQQITLHPALFAQGFTSGTWPQLLLRVQEGDMQMLNDTFIAGHYTGLLLFLL